MGLFQITVGAGTSGCVLAAKLSAADPLNRILLIEAGGEPPWYSWIPLIAPVLQGTRHDWKYKTTSQKKRINLSEFALLFPLLIYFKFISLSNKAILLASRKNGMIQFFL